MSTTVEEIETTKTTEDKKDELLLDSLEIKGYRCFEHLTIEKLGRVNLIVGKNNVGKTALLEALWIYATRGTSETILRLLNWRDEVPFYVADANSRNILFQKEDLMSQAGNMFYGRPKLDLGSNEEITVSSSNSSLHIYTTKLMDQDENLISDPVLFQKIWGTLPRGLLIFSKFKVLNQDQIQTEFYSLDVTQSFIPERIPELKHEFISSGILDNLKLVQLWDEAVINNLEEEALKFLQIIENKIEYINFVATSRGMRYPIASNGKSSNRVTLKSYGEGMSRLLGLSLAFVQCNGGILLIDEIESGLHYSVLPDVWKLIFKTAKDLNVQVFATTHSKDCIEAFAQAAYDSPEDGMLIRLERQGEKIVAKTIEEERLVDAVNFNVEVR